MHLSLIRHTSVELDGNIVCYGNTDVAVSANFATEAEILKQSVQHLKPDAIFSSPLTRAKLLAEYVGFSPIVFDNRLKELNFGELEMHPWEEILVNEDIEAYFEYYVENPFPGGESLREQQLRVKSFLDEKKQVGLSHIMVFCHGGVINAIRSLVSGLPLRQVFASTPPFATLISIDYR